MQCPQRTQERSSSWRMFSRTSSSNSSSSHTSPSITWPLLLPLPNTLTSSYNPSTLLTQTSSRPSPTPSTRLATSHHCPHSLELTSTTHQESLTHSLQTFKSLLKFHLFNLNFCLVHSCIYLIICFFVCVFVCFCKCKASSSVQTLPFQCKHHRQFLHHPA